MIGSIGPMEITVIVVIVLLIFGPRQLPKLGRSIGETIRELRHAGKAFTENVEGKDDHRGA